MGAAADATRPLSVLVVDDDRDTVESTVTLLELRGLRAAGAYGGREAVRAAASDPPDVVLIDLAMPGVDGIEAGRQILERAGGPGPVLVAVTGMGDAPLVERARRAGFDLYLVKPVRSAELFDALRQCALARRCDGPG